MPESVVKVFVDRSALTLAVAEAFTRAAEQAVAQRGRFLTALAGGGTPQALHELLAQLPYRDRLPWAHMHFFWGDERCVPPDHAESNYGQAQQALLDHVAAPPENIHRVRGEWDPYAAAADYIRQLRALAEPGLTWPRFDWVFLGLGGDGHTASLFPESPLPTPDDVPVTVVTAHYQGRPAERVTLTPQVFNVARAVAFVATGKAKALAVAATLAGPHDPVRWPAQRIAPDDGVITYWLDAGAASQLPGIGNPASPILE
jgi:6-phosphogluconolactonase